MDKTANKTKELLTDQAKQNRESIEYLYDNGQKCLHCGAEIVAGESYCSQVCESAPRPLPGRDINGNPTATWEQVKDGFRN